MSAIFGLVYFDQRPAPRAHLERMSAALAHHGAAGGGLWMGDRVGLGQRLQPFTPADVWERQPLSSRDGRCVLVSDARIDNRRELTHALAAAGVDTLPADAPQTPDSALILHAYTAWGPECVHHLTGVYAFAIWDAPAATLFAARSPVTAPALYYTQPAGAVAFATMPSGLHALPGVPCALHEPALANLLAGIAGSPVDTLYRDILRLPTGHRLLAGPTGVTTDCFWRPDLARDLRLGGDSEVLEAFDALFTRVVDDHLVSLTPVALQLSGGLDSSAVAAVAAPRLAARGERLAAFTEVPRAGFAGAQPQGGYADETPFVQAIAAMLPALDLHLLRTDGQVFLDGLDGLFPYLEMPFQNTANRVWIEAILQAARQGGRQVLLDGMQGNLTLSWHGRGLFVDLARRGRWAQAWSEAAALKPGRGPLRTARSLAAQALLPLLPDPLWLAVDWLRHPTARRAPASWVGQLINPTFAAAQGLPGRTRSIQHAARFRPAADTRRQRMEALASQDAGAYLSAYRAMFGVDMRSPTADVRLAEFCLALPEDQFLRGGETRRLVRQAMAGRLPAEVLTNRRRGMQAADWFDRLAGARVQVAVQLNRLAQSDLAQRVLDVPRLRQLFDRMPASAVHDFDSLIEYRTVLERGLMIGAFLCWLEAGRPPVPPTPA